MDYGNPHDGSRGSSGGACRSCRRCRRCILQVLRAGGAGCEISPHFSMPEAPFGVCQGEACAFRGRAAQRICVRQLRSDRQVLEGARDGGLSEASFWICEGATCGVRRVCQGQVHLQVLRPDRRIDTRACNFPMPEAPRRFRQGQAYAGKVRIAGYWRTKCGRRERGVETVIVVGPAIVVPSSAFHVPGGMTTWRDVAPLASCGATRSVSPIMNSSLTAA